MRSHTTGTTTALNGATTITVRPTNAAACLDVLARIEREYHRGLLCGPEVRVLLGELDPILPTLRVGGRTIRALADGLLAEVDVTALHAAVTALNGAADAA